MHEGFQYLSETHKADYLRTYFMHFHGGAYCDIKKLQHSWKNCMESFLKDENCWIMGYKEIGPHGCASIKNDPEMTKRLKENWECLIGNGAYMCKPLTPLTKEWYTKLLNKMDEVKKVSFQRYKASIFKGLSLSLYLDRNTWTNISSLIIKSQKLY